jgi:iron complex transport system substrate-binding protein
MIVVLRALALLLALAAAVDAAAVGVSVQDDDGRRVALPAPARRIVSLAPHATEILFAAGAGRAVVGVTAWSDFPPEASAIPHVGDAIGLDLERIVALAPDLVVTWPWTAPAQVEHLRARGMAVYMIDAKTISGIAVNVERLATLAGTSGDAAPAVAHWRRRLRALEERPAKAPSLRVFYQLGDAPMFTIGGPQLITQAIALCGGHNAFAKLASPAPMIDTEAVVGARPQVIVAGTDHAQPPAWLAAWQRWPDLPAVKAGNLFTVDAMLLHRPGPRFLDGVEQLCGVMDRARP